MFCKRLKALLAPTVSSNGFSLAKSSGLYVEVKLFSCSSTSSSLIKAFSWAVALNSCFFSGVGSVSLSSSTSTLRRLSSWLFGISSISIFKVSM